MFSFCKYCQTTLQDSRTNLYNLTNSVGNSFCSRSLSTFFAVVLFIFTNSGCVMVSHGILICISGVTSEIEHLFICLLTVWIPTVVKWLSLLFILFGCLSSSGQRSFVSYMWLALQISYFVFWWIQSLSFNMAKITIFSILFIDFLMFLLRSMLILWRYSLWFVFIMRLKNPPGIDFSVWYVIGIDFQNFPLMNVQLFQDHLFKSPPYPTTLQCHLYHK